MHFISSENFLFAGVSTVNDHAALVFPRLFCSRAIGLYVSSCSLQLVHMSAVRSSRYEALGKFRGHSYASFMLSKLSACVISRWTHSWRNCDHLFYNIFSSDLFADVMSVDKFTSYVLKILERRTVTKNCLS